jgi:peptide/nickel transport system ATP-binding protein
VPNPNQNRSRVELPGEVGDAVNIPQGCRFKDRCPEYMEGVCDKEPTLEKKDETTSDRKVSCHLYE